MSLLVHYYRAHRDTFRRTCGLGRWKGAALSAAEDAFGALAGEDVFMVHIHQQINKTFPARILTS
jgi:hypothetical protein